MKEKSIEKDEEILNNIKAYMQENIDKGYHKFVYNDLGYDEKCVDVINAIEHILSDYKRTLKENEELKEKENKIYKEVQESLAFEKFLIVKERKPDLFNQGRFYISQIIYDILNDTQNPEGIHKENKCIQYIDYIPIQKVKDNIEELNQYYKKEIYPSLSQWSDITITEHYDEMIELLQELLGDK